ncbi:cation transporting ATPase C-terminal domain-containing protein [Pseudarthrobacter sp. So.54]
MTQTLIIFVIRTRRVPFFRSKPSPGLVGASLGVVALGVYLPLSPLAGVLGFDPLPVPFFLALLGMAAVYLVLVELAKLWFYARAAQQPVSPRIAGVRRRGRSHSIARRAARFSTARPSPLLLNRGPGRRGRIRAQRPSHPRGS